ncbi:MAG: portal protein [Oceanospirillaceae bacterium]|nr:portal protein [Oceanospirillaceae bacterium]
MSVSSHARRLHKILIEIDHQPSWRDETARCHQYYDGKQLPPELIRQLQERGIPQLTTNLIQPPINGVLGMEARSRTDWFVRADDDEYTEVAEGLNVRVNEGLRTAKANRACAEAYAAQVKGGLGWVEVKPNSDPFGSKYRIRPIHYNEIEFDWRTEADLSNCNWLLRHRWVDKEEAEAAFPKHKELIRLAIGNWDQYDTRAHDAGGDVLSNAYDEYQYCTRKISDWLNDVRDMVRIYELYYRVWDQGLIIRDEQGRAVVFNENNRLHMALVAAGRVTVEKRMVPSLRLSWFIGPHHVADMPSPHPHNHFPYVPFFAAREDETLIPYGLIRGMLSPQDEINFRRIKLTAGLNQKRIVMDDNATKMEDDSLREEVHRQDGIVKLDGSATKRDGTKPRFEIQQDTGIHQQQFNIMENASKNLQEVGGIYNAFLGKDGGAQSGVAINSLVEQGATTLADINDNYRWARQQVGELVLAHEVEELKGRQNVSVMVPGKYGQKARQVVLNQDSDGGEPSNAVAYAKTQVVLGEVQQSQGYRAQVTQMLLDLIGKMPQEVQLPAMSLVLDQIDLPEEKKSELQKIINKVTGNVDPDEMDEQELAALQQQQQKQQAMDELAMKEVMLKLQELEAKIQKFGADAQLTTEKAGTEQMRQKEMAVQIRRDSAVAPPLPRRLRQPQTSFGQ